MYSGMDCIFFDMVGSLQHMVYRKNCFRDCGGVVSKSKNMLPNVQSVGIYVYEKMAWRDKDDEVETVQRLRKTSYIQRKR